MKIESNKNELKLSIMKISKADNFTFYHVNFLVFFVHNEYFFSVFVYGGETIFVLIYSSVVIIVFLFNRWLLESNILIFTELIRKTGKVKTPMFPKYIFKNTFFVIFLL